MLAALSFKNRTLHKLYVLGTDRVKKLEKFQSNDIVNRAKAHNVPIRYIERHEEPLMDKMSGGRAHNVWQSEQFLSCVRLTLLRAMSWKRHR